MRVGPGLETFDTPRRTTPKRLEPRRSQQRLNLSGIMSPCFALFAFPARS